MLRFRLTLTASKGRTREDGNAKELPLFSRLRLPTRAQELGISVDECLPEQRAPV